MTKRIERRSEGEVFDLPLRRGGWCTGLIARASRDGVCVAYFYGPRREQPPAADELVMPPPGDAILIARFGVSAFASGTWKVRGTASNWDRDRWRPLEFVEMPPFGGARVVVYDDKDPNQVVAERRPQSGEAARLPDGDLHGYGIIRNHIDDLLDRADAGEEF